MVRQVSNRGRTFLVEDLAKWEDFDFWTHAYECGWEADTHDILDRNLTLETVLLDIGAWVGPFVLYSSSLCHSIIALEPDPVAFDMLRKNISHNKVKNAIILEEALWDGSEVTLGVKEEGDMGDSMTSILYSGCTRTVTAKSTTLEKLVYDFALNPSNVFVKMDIEGAEADALLMNWDFISEHLPPMWLSLHAPLVEDKAAYTEKIKKIIDLYETDTPIPVGYGSLLLKRN